MIEPPALEQQTYRVTTAKSVRLSLGDIRRSWLFWGILFFRITLDILYPMMIVKDYWHYGFIFAPRFDRYVLSYVAMLLLISALLPLLSVQRPSSIMLLLLFTLGYVPNMTLFAGMALPYSFFLLSNLYWLCFTFFYRYVNFQQNQQKKMYMSKRRNIQEYWVILFFLIAVSVFSILYNGGIKLTISLSDVYELRMGARARGLGGIFDKVLPWAANVILPIGIIMAIRDKRWGLAAMFILGVVFAFSVNGTKTWLFIGAVALFMAVFVREDRRIGLLPFVLAVSNVGGYILGKYYYWSFINNYITRRVFFSTSLSNYFWLDFFSKNPKLLMTNSLLGWVRRLGVKVPYDENVSYIIGRTYYGNAEMTAASGTIAEAYANFGIVGIILFPLILVLAFKLLDRAAQESRLLYLYPIIVTAAIYLLNGSIMTALVTYGYFIGLLLVWYLNRKNALSI